MRKARRTLPVIELNAEFKQALDLMENSSNSVFITGRAGTGKSTLLGYFCQNTRKNVAVLAPTGVAALNVKGQTIHSFFKFRPNITQDRIKRLRQDTARESLYKNLDAIVIDEISMVRADLLDCVDKFLRLNGPDQEKPFGGIQMIFIGDLYQLPPVVSGNDREVFKLLYATPYFFGAHVFGTFEMEFLELQKVYRQHDQRFINLLNSVRNNSITEEDLRLLNQRCMPGFQPSARDFYIFLTTTNAMAESINSRQLETLRGELLTFAGAIEGEFGKEYLPTAVDLQVKKGAQIMMLNNDAQGRWVNGSVGEITGFRKDQNGEEVLIADLGQDNVVEVAPFTWEIYRSYVEDSDIKSEVIGTFRQYPIMLAWAVTIHKSQGKTFEKVVIDIGNGAFAHGQVYVGLSRCTTLEGLVLLKPLQKKHIWMDYRVVEFVTKYQYQKGEQNCSSENKLEMIRRAIAEKSALQIVYLKPRDEKSTRVILPRQVGPMEYQGKTYVGIRALCLMRHEERTFRVDRILEIRKADGDGARELMN
jgi:ATP-dependent DNA helicase PIF1